MTENATEEPKRSKIELIKEGSRQLRGTIADELAGPAGEFEHDAEVLLKLHGIYQQDDRDQRKAKKTRTERRRPAFTHLWCGRGFRVGA